MNKAGPHLMFTCRGYGVDVALISEQSYEWFHRISRSFGWFDVMLPFALAYVQSGMSLVFPRGRYHEVLVLTFIFHLSCDPGGPTDYCC